MTEGDYIQIPIEEYEKLVRDASAGTMLAYTILRGAELNYRNDGLTFNDAATNAALKAYDINGWRHTICELKDELEARMKEVKK